MIPAGGQGRKREGRRNLMSNLLGALDPGGTLMKYYTVSEGPGTGG